MERPLLIVTILFLCFGFLSVKANRLIPFDLKVEYLSEAQGLDVIAPRFSWLLESSKVNRYGLSQSAYRILVASSPERLKKDNADMWDSRWVRSSDMNQVVYAGKSLLSDRTYYWKVIVKDSKQGLSRWSPIAKWTTGILHQDLWKANWIGGTDSFTPTASDCNLWDPWLRKSFVLNKVPKQANLLIASIGYHEVYVNGQRVGDEVMAPVVTDHTKRARYVLYDIAPYLTHGKNVIGLWLGVSWSIFPGYRLDNGRIPTPMVSAQVDFYDVMPQENTPASQTVMTDSSWKIKNSPNKLLGIWDFGKMGGELWDDQKAENNWNQINYDDSGWKSATHYDLPLRISAQNTKGNKVDIKIRPVAIEELAGGKYRVDMGINFAGWTQIKIKGKPGDRIDFYYSEREKEEMTFGMHSAFIIGEHGEGVFKNRFNYSSGRWITIKGLTYKPSLEDVNGWLIRSDFEEVACFRSSDTLQNWIYDKVKWNFKNLSIGGFIVDCPQRERMGYGGDAHATSETGMYNFDLGSFYTKWMQDWRDVQGTEPMVGNMNDVQYARKEMTSGRIFNNGILPHTAPTYWGGGGPAWGGIVVTLPWFMYEYYGDKQGLRNNYSLIKKWLAFLDSNVEKDLLKRFGGKWDFLGDWLWPNATAEGMNNDKEETRCLNNTYRVYNLRTAAKIARVLGDDSQAEVWEMQAEKSSLAINDVFYNREKHIYADGAMANLAAALLAEVVPSGDVEKVLKSLEHEILITRKGHIHAGITGGALLFKLLRSYGRNDLIYSMTSKKEYPGWGFMKENNATTIWEMWEKDLPGHSLLHSSYLYPGAWYIEGVLGIRSKAPGFREFIIEPPTRSETDLKFAQGSYYSAAGLIKSGWSRDDGRLKLSVTVPVNTNCLLVLDEMDAKIIKVKKGIVVETERRNNKRVFKLVSGNYSFW